MAIIITNYSEKYRDDVRNICLDTAGSNAREGKSMRFLLATFCDYYIDREAEHCFIAVDEDTDSAVGYIFCAPDYQNTSVYSKPNISRASRAVKRRYN